MYFVWKQPAEPRVSELDEARKVLMKSGSQAASIRRVSIRLCCLVALYLHPLNIIMQFRYKRKCPTYVQTKLKWRGTGMIPLETGANGIANDMKANKVIDEIDAARYSIIGKK